MERITIEINSNGKYCGDCQYFQLDSDYRAICRIFPGQGLQYKKEATRGFAPFFTYFTRLKDCLDCSSDKPHNEEQQEDNEPH